MIPTVRTVAETAIFQRYAAEIWREDEVDEFITWIAANPTAGDVIPVLVVAGKFAGFAGAVPAEASEVVRE